MPPRRLTYREIADDLTARIKSGEHPPGALLPSRSELMKLYTVSRSTADRAMLLLIDRGVAYGEPGRGTYVVGPPED